MSLWQVLFFYGIAVFQQRDATTTSKKQTSAITFYLIQKSIFVSYSFLLEYKSAIKHREVARFS